MAAPKLLFMERHPLHVLGTITPLEDLWVDIRALPDDKRLALKPRETQPYDGAEARAALRAFVAVGEPGRWIAEQRPWQAAPRGWTVTGELQGCRFRLEVMPGGVRVVASAPSGGEPAVWFVPG